MNKIKLLIIFIFLLIMPFIVKAESCDVEKISIESISVVDIIGNATEKSEASINGNNIVLDLSMNDVGDSITYQIVVKNDSNDDFELDDSSMETKSEYIKYTFNDNDSVTVKAKSTKDVELKVEYKTQVPASLLVGDAYNDNENLLLSLSTLINPKTGYNVLTTVFITLAIGIIGYFYSNKKKIPSVSVVIIGLMIITPIVINAVCKADININSNVEIKKIAEFDKGKIVNSKMIELAGNADNIKSFRRSDTLPDNVKSLVETQLSANTNVTVSEEEINEKLEYIKNNAVSFTDYFVKDDYGVYDYCENVWNNATCYEKNYIIELISYDGVMVLKSSDSDVYQYLIYDNNELKILTEEEYKEIIRDNITNAKKSQLTKNILSSDNTDYLIYSWYDDNKIYYYCEVEQVYFNRDSSYMFSNLHNLNNFPSISNINAFNTIDMSYMFYETGFNKDVFDLDLSSWNTSNVTNMSYMFKNKVAEGLHPKADYYNLNLTGWDTSKVTDMTGMFSGVGYISNTWSIKGLDNWDTGNLKSIDYMFFEAGRYADKIELDFSNWNTSKMESMSYVFWETGLDAQVWTIGDISNWDTSKVTNMSGLLAYAGGLDPSFQQDLSRWDVSNVLSMTELFYGSGRNFGNLTNWNTSKVRSMSGMFNSMPLETIGDISHWDVSKVRDMSGMFSGSDTYGQPYVLDLSHWDISNVEDIDWMFSNAGTNATSFNLNLSNWNLSKVTDLSYMFYRSGYNSQATVINVSNWNTSNIANIDSIFGYSGYNSTSWNIVGLSTWDTSKVSLFTNAFVYSGYSTEIYTLDISNWNTSSATSFGNTFLSAGYNSTTFNLDLSNWDTSKVTTMMQTFSKTGYNATSWSVGDLSNWNNGTSSMQYMFTEAGYNATTWHSIGTFRINGINIEGIFNDCPKAKAILNIYSNPRYYTKAFKNAATADDASIVVNYSSNTTSIDNIIATKTSDSHVTKGVLLN